MRTLSVTTKMVLIHVPVQTDFRVTEPHVKTITNATQLTHATRMPPAPIISVHSRVNVTPAGRNQTEHARILMNAMRIRVTQMPLALIRTVPLHAIVTTDTLAMAKIAQTTMSVRSPTEGAMLMLCAKTCRVRIAVLVKTAIPVMEPLVQTITNATIIPRAASMKTAQTRRDLSPAHAQLDMRRLTAPMSVPISTSASMVPTLAMETPLVPTLKRLTIAHVTLGTKETEILARTSTSATLPTPAKRTRNAQIQQVHLHATAKQDSC